MIFANISFKHPNNGTFDDISCYRSVAPSKRRWTAEMNASGSGIHFKHLTSSCHQIFITIVIMGIIVVINKKHQQHHHCKYLPTLIWFLFGYGILMGLLGIFLDKDPKKHLRFDRLSPVARWFASRCGITPLATTAPPPRPRALTPERGLPVMGTRTSTDQLGAGSAPVFSTWKKRPNIITGWWFGTFFFPYIGNNHPNWPIFFRGVETTNQFL